MRTDKAEVGNIKTFRNVHDSSKGYISISKGMLIKTVENPIARDLVLFSAYGEEDPKRFVVLVGSEFERIASFDKRATAETCAIGCCTFFDEVHVVDVNYTIKPDEEQRDTREENNISRNYHPEQGDDN